MESALTLGVSYSGRSSRLVDTLESNLLAFGVKVVRYEKSTGVGKNVEEFIDALSSMSLVLVVLSEGYVSSDYCLLELCLIASNEGVRVLVASDGECDWYGPVNARLDGLAKCSGEVGWAGERASSMAGSPSVREALNAILKRRWLSAGEVLSGSGARMILEALDFMPESYIAELEEILSEPSLLTREMLFDDYLASHFANDYYFTFKARSYMKAESHESALHYYLKALSVNPESMTAFLDICDLIGQGQVDSPKSIEFDSLMENFSEKVKRHSRDHLRAMRAKGIVCLSEHVKTGDKELLASSIRCLKDALRVEPGDALALNALGQAYDYLSEIDAAEENRAKAVRCLEDAVENRDGYFQAMNNLGILHLKSGRTEEAAQWFEAALAVDPSYDLALNNLAISLESSNPGRAASLYVKQLCANVPRSDLLNNVGTFIDEEYSCPSLARPFLEAAVSKSGSFSSRYNLANIRRKLGEDPAGVRAELRSLAAERPDVDLPRFALALSYAQAGEFDQFEDSCIATLEVNPTFWPGWAALSIWPRRGEPFLPKDELLDDCEYPILLDIVARAKLDRGEVDSADRLFERAGSFAGALTPPRRGLGETDLAFHITELERTFQKESSCRVRRQQVVRIARDEVADLRASMAALSD